MYRPESRQPSTPCTDTVDDARLEIELIRLDLAARKAGGLDDDEEPEDDGFLAALSGAAEDWTMEKKVENDEEATADI